MKFRRHQTSGLAVNWTRFGSWLGTRLGRVSGRMRIWRRHLRVPEGPDDPRRKWLVGGSVAAGMFLIGYLFAAIVLFPAPIFPRSNDVPRVIGLTFSDAQRAIDDALLVVSDTELVSHPEIESGRIVWQDPPPKVAVPQGSGVSLWLSRGPRPIPVPDLAGYERSLAGQLIEAAGLTLARVDTTVAPQERGVVVNTRPPAGRSLVPGSGVTLFVSVGNPSISVPNLTGFTVEEAREALEELGLVLGSTRSRRTTTGEPGIILEQNPAAGTLSAPGGVVNVTIVRGERS